MRNVFCHGYGRGTWFTTRLGASGGEKSPPEKRLSGKRKLGIGVAVLGMIGATASRDGLTVLFWLAVLAWAAWPLIKAREEVVKPPSDLEIPK
jgi:hypothetical protein